MQCSVCDLPRLPKGNWIVIHNTDEKDYVWSTENTIGHRQPCYRMYLVINVNVKLEHPNPGKITKSTERSERNVRFANGLFFI